MTNCKENVRKHCQKLNTNEKNSSKYSLDKKQLSELTATSLRQVLILFQL